jgi:hypothetical protein
MAPTHIPENTVNDIITLNTLHNVHRDGIRGVPITLHYMFILGLPSGFWPDRYLWRCWRSKVGRLCCCYKDRAIRIALFLGIGYIVVLNICIYMHAPKNIYIYSDLMCVHCESQLQAGWGQRLGMGHIIIRMCRRQSQKATIVRNNGRARTPDWDCSPWP